MKLGIALSNLVGTLILAVSVGAGRASAQCDCDSILALDIVNEFALNKETDMTEILRHSILIENVEAWQQAAEGGIGINVPLAEGLLGMYGNAAEQQLKEIHHKLLYDEDYKISDAETRQVFTKLRDSEVLLAVIAAWQNCMDKCVSPVVGSSITISPTLEREDLVEITVGYKPASQYDPDPIVSKMTIQGAELIDGDLVGEELNQFVTRVILLKPNPNGTIYLSLRSTTVSDRSIVIDRDWEALKNEILTCRSERDDLAVKLAEANAQIQKIIKNASDTQKSLEKIKNDFESYKRDANPKIEYYNIVKMYLDRDWMDHKSDEAGGRFRLRSEQELKKIFTRDELVHDWVDVVMGPDAP